MGLAPGEQRMLAEIENQLSRSDPRLASMFARFATDGARKRPLLRRLPRCGPEPAGRTRMIILVAVSAILLITCAAMAVIGASSATPSRGGYGFGASPAGSYFLGRSCLGRVTCSRLFSDSARLYSSARWASVRSSTSWLPLSVR